jgi:hypothetical protein
MIRINPHSLNKMKGQIIFLIVSIVLVLFVFLVIILGNITTSSFQFSATFKNFVSLKSLVISGLRYALYQINQNPNFTTTSAQVLMPQGSFTYSVSNINSTTKRINIQASLTANLSNLSKVLNATVTIDSFGKILDLQANEE